MSQTKTSKRGLGRGLSALIPEGDLDLLSGFARGTIAPAPLPVSSSDGTSPPATAPAPAPATSDWNGAVRYLPVSRIEANPFQPRQVFSEIELEDLASSLREHGVLQPVLVRPLGEDRFQLIAGERRWRASMRAGLETIPAIVREVDDQTALELAIIENVQRHDISPFESATAFKRLATEFGLSQEKIAARVGKSRASVANTLRLLDLPAEALEALKSADISEGHGRALLMAPTDEARRALLRRAVRDSLSVREVERLAREASQSDADAPRRKRTVQGESDIARLENTLQRALGTRVQIRARARGGALVVHYSSPEELARLSQKLTAKTEGSK
jgi:ParB family chromosome partitioning protein